jgi:hypothetical protein
MSLNVAREMAALGRLTLKQLRARYVEVFGEETNAQNKAWLVKRIAWRMQALQEGDLSERARRRAAELARDADLRLNPPSIKAGHVPAQQVQIHVLELDQDDRLPPPGTVVTRKYKGNVLQVKVLPHGFEYDGAVYASLSAVAKAITGSHCNGYLFFRLRGRGGDA